MVYSLLCCRYEWSWDPSNMDRNTTLARASSHFICKNQFTSVDISYRCSCGQCTTFTWRDADMLSLAFLFFFPLLYEEKNYKYKSINKIKGEIGMKWGTGGKLKKKGIIYRKCINHRIRHKDRQNMEQCIYIATWRVVSLARLSRGRGESGDTRIVKLCSAAIAFRRYVPEIAIDTKRSGCRIYYKRMYSCSAVRT